MDNHIPIESWDEDSFPVDVQQFDWETVFAKDSPESVPAEYAEIFEAGRKAGRREMLELHIALLRWKDANGRATISGLVNREIVEQFLFNPDYMQATQADMLRRYGINSKQLINREASHYRDHFEMKQKDPRFYSAAARAAYARRFEK